MISSSNDTRTLDAPTKPLSDSTVAPSTSAGQPKSGTCPSEMSEDTTQKHPVTSSQQRQTTDSISSSPPIKRQRHVSLPVVPKSQSHISTDMTDFPNPKRAATMPQRPVGSPKRRYTDEARTNIHTECGRHSDDWLFGGFKIGAVMRRIWGKKE